MSDDNGRRVRSAGRRGVAVVTGGSAGVGRSTAIAFAEAGYDVAVMARGAAGLQATVADIEARGQRGLAVTADVGDWDQVKAGAERVERDLGPVDVWVNNAMTTVFAPFDEVQPSEIRRATEVTYLGQVHGTLAALSHMLPRDRGSIVSVGSALAFVGIPLQAAYCGAKFATRGFCESVRAELLARGSAVTLSQVHLPAVNTPQFDWCLSRLPKQPQPVPPIYDPDVAARAILAAALDGRRSKTLGVWNTLIVSGTKFAPGFLAHFAAHTGIESQQTDRPVDPDRPANLWRPVDDDRDVGARGGFDDRSGGVVDPAFLRDLPETARNVAVAAGANLREKVAFCARWATNRRRAARTVR
jgi:NAD(P)-dependent dehydrogenase (short-subunit alcohol dehydrogenase family)